MSYKLNGYIFGLQRTGTNYLRDILNKNYYFSALNTHKYCWKHSVNVPKEYQSHKPTFIIIKHPYTWLESILFRTPLDITHYHNDYTLQTSKGWVISELIRLYNNFYNNWQSHGLVIKYENLLTEVGIYKQFMKIEKEYLMERKGDKIIMPESGKVAQSPNFRKDDMLYYLREEPRDLTDTQIREVNESIDTRIVETYDYLLK